MKRVERLFDIYMIMFFCLVLIVNIYFIYIAKVNVLYVIPAIIVFGIMYLITVKIRTNYFGVLLFLFALFNKLLMILIIKTPPISDFSVLLDASNLVAVGNYSFKNWDCFARWEYQSGFVVYQAFLIKLFGNNIIVLKAINCLWIALTTLLVYKIGVILFGEYSGKIAGLIHSVYIPLFLFAPVLTNQHISTVFYYLALYFIVQKEDKAYRKWIYSGICFALGNILRPIGIVFVIAIFILSFSNIFKYDNKRDGVYISIKKLGLCLGTYLVILYSVCSILVITNITNTGLKNNNPYWKFVIGLNEKTSGRYSFEDAQNIIYNSKSTEEIIEKEKEVIIERLNIPPYRMGKLLVNKVRYMWGDYEAGVFTFPHLLDKKIVKWGYSFDYIFKEIQEFEKIFFVIIVCLVLYALINYYKEKNQNEYVKLLYYIVTIYTCVHLIIEISFRYKYAIMGAVFILAGKGGELLIQKYIKI